MPRKLNRREILTRTLGAAAVAAAGPGLELRAFPPAIQDLSSQAPSSPVSLLRCESYDPQTFRTCLEKSLDLIGGVGDLVQGKTVTIKVNLTGMTWEPVDGLPARETYQTHPHSLAALCAILNDAGARRIYVVETLYWKKPFEEILEDSGWDVKAIQSAGGHKVQFEDIRNRGSWSDYARFQVPWGGFMFPAFDLNRRFHDTDVLISLAKLKEHACAGITGVIKNCFGNTPCSLYGNDSPSEDALLHRTSIFHNGEKPVSGDVPAELEHGKSNSQFVRVPNITADIYGARPADLGIVDGVRTIRGGEGHWNRGVSVVEPKLLIAGRNGVCTDAVCTAAMGFDPLAAPETKPFPGDNHLNLMASVGLGTNDPERIEVAGLSLEEAVFPFSGRTA
ncbi:MAG: DUF362 domain-containing protein [Acidobacteriota bacterium]|nr:MAG: DUF362 domain-containing protein [Acidobacteriota bacterium]